MSAGIPNTTWLARALFTEFLLPFEVAAVILTVAVIAAVMLTLRRRVGVKHQSPSAQVRRQGADRAAHGQDGGHAHHPAAPDAAAEEKQP